MRFFFSPQSRLSLSMAFVNVHSLVAIIADVNNNCLGLTDGDVGLYVQTAVSIAAPAQRYARPCEVAWMPQPWQ